MEAVIGGSRSEDAPIKYESPYAGKPSPLQPSVQSPTKRQRTPSVDVDEGGDTKRQRIEPAMIENDELARIIAQATASATQQFEQSTNGGTNNDANENSSYSTAPTTNNNVEDGAGDFNSDFSTDPRLYMRIMSLPILESLSTQILSTLARGPYSETINIITQPESELGQAYATLKSLFDQTKKIYSQQKPFLSADELGIRESEHRATIRTTNLATFLSSVFGGQDVGFYELNDNFLDTFVPEGMEIKQEPGKLFLNLKTQMYLSAISQEEQERSREDTLEDLFPSDLDQKVLAQRHGAELTTSEVEFVDEAKQRKYYLRDQPADADTISTLSEKYAWEDFLKSLSIYLKSNHEPLISPFLRRHALNAPPSRMSTTTTQASASQGLSDQDVVEQATRAAQVALQSVGYGFPNSSQQTHGENAYSQQGMPSSQANGFGQQQYTGALVPYPTQTAPTQVLYEQARQAAVAKASPHSRRPGLPSQRRPWSTEEENALMAGLDQVKGPHWSQILALYGARGQVSEILRDRNQVQLKDKARNLKLFFLKSNIEVPYYLQCVTGELKTRAPSQAARQEAQERARLVTDEEQARFNGIMTLAGGIGGIDGALDGGGEQGAADSSTEEQQINPINDNNDVSRNETPFDAEEQQQQQQQQPPQEKASPKVNEEQPLAAAVAASRSPQRPLSYEESVERQLLAGMGKAEGIQPTNPESITS